MSVFLTESVFPLETELTFSSKSDKKCFQKDNSTTEAYLQLSVTFYNDVFHENSFNVF